MLFVALGQKLLGARRHLRRFECLRSPRRIVCCHCRNLRNAGVIGRDRTNRQAGQDGELLGQGHCSRLQVQPFELELGGCQPGLQQVAQWINASLGALLLNWHKPVAQNSSCWRAASSSR